MTSSTTHPTATGVQLHQAVASLRDGGVVALVESPGRGRLVAAPGRLTPAALALLGEHCRSAVSVLAPEPALGVLGPAGGIEGVALRLGALAGGGDVSVCELARDDEAAAESDAVAAFAAVHGLLLLECDEESVSRAGGVPRIAADAALPTRCGDFRVVAFDGAVSALALVRGTPDRCDAPLVRIHRACAAGEVLRGVACDCAAVLEDAMDVLSGARHAILVYLRDGDGLSAQVGAWAGGASLCGGAAGAAAQGASQAGSILRGLGVERIRLLARDGEPGAEIPGIGVVARLPLLAPAATRRRAS